MSSLFLKINVVNKNVITKANEILQKAAIQRVFYSLGLLIWTLMYYDSLKNHPNSISSLSISYLTLYLIPASILFIQIIINNRIVWFIIFLMFSVYIIDVLYSVITHILFTTGEKAFIPSFENIFGILLLISIFLLIDWIIYSLKPSRKNVNFIIEVKSKS